MPSGPKQLMTPPISDGPRQRAKSTPNHALRSAPLVSLLSAVPLPPPSSAPLYHRRDLAAPFFRIKTLAKSPGRPVEAVA
jgi:hypothetical protein